MTETPVITDKHTLAKPSRRQTLDQQIIAGAALKLAYGGRYSTPLAYALGVSRNSVRDWINGRRLMPASHQRDLLALIDQTIECYQRARVIYAFNLAAKEREPARKRGFLAVEDHGDGLPPHNQQAHVLKRLGLSPKAKSPNGDLQAKK